MRNHYLQLHSTYGKIIREKIGKAEEEKDEAGVEWGAMVG